MGRASISGLRRSVCAFPFVLVCACIAEREAKEQELRSPVALERGQAQFERLCGRPGLDDLVIDLFCARAQTGIQNLIELREAMGLDAKPDDASQGFALTGHSTGLSQRSVSSINPRIIFIRPESNTKELAALAFARGEQSAEIVVRSRTDDELRFYLVAFSQECNAAPSGCSPGDLLTEAVESNWTEVSVYAEEDLENTSLDCRVCHQPNGPGTPKLLRMQELEPPWNHWFFDQVLGGQALFQDYFAAKGDEPLAGLASEALTESQPGLLSYVIHGLHPGPQPNEFVSATIEREVIASSAAAGGNQPFDNSMPGSSPTWGAIYESSKRGEAISVPYYNVKITDARKLDRATRAYGAYRAGMLGRQSLPDLRDIHPDDALRRAYIGLSTEPLLSGGSVLLQACGQCHNDRLDQALSRARFNVNLSTLDREAKDQAIARVLLPLDHPLTMPPSRFRRLTDEGREKLITLLRQ